MLVFWGYLELCDRVRGMNLIELLAGLAAAFGFVYLIWALLRPEDLLTMSINGDFLTLATLGVAVIGSSLRSWWVRVLE